MKKFGKILILLILSINISYAKTIRVAVIDTGFDFKSNWGKFSNKTIDTQTGLMLRRPKLCKSGHKDFTYTSIQDIHGHGTHVSGIIAKHAENVDYCLVIIKFFTDDANDEMNSLRLVSSIKHAVDLGVDIINISGGGPNPTENEYKVIKKALDKNITIIAAAGNEALYIDKNSNVKFYPACYDKKIISVQATDTSGILIQSSNHGPIFNGIEIGRNVLSLWPNNSVNRMTGTSQATAVRTGKEIKNMVYSHKESK